MIPQFIYVHPSFADEMKRPSFSRKTKYVSVDFLKAWANTNRLNANPLPYEHEAKGQNDALDALIAMLNTE